ncbi:MAG: twitch domain-containing radical SAM protein, partial [Bdellovibrionales bacterium]
MSCNSKSSKFCALAWVHRFTNVGGEIQVCCTSEETDNNIYSNDGKKMKIGDAYSDEQILNSSYMKNLRKQLLSGEWPEICGRCKVTEEIGGVSRRVDENRHFASLTGKLLESTAPDGTIPVEVKSADYRLGNLCNLACRMCNPCSSTPWLKYSQAFAKGSQPFSAEELAEFARMNWYESPKFIAYVKTQLPSLEHLHFAGGEPLINPQMEPLLRQCVDLGVAKNITLTYNTNLTKISDEIKALWPEFKAVHLYISIDAFGKLNDYIRHPSRWSVIDA